MIDKRKCIEIILETVPEFNDDWNKHIEWWKGETPGLCSDLSEFASFIMENISNLSNDRLIEVFKMVEIFVNRGDKEVVGATVTCFLEDLQNAYDDNPKILKFVKYLGVESKKYCIIWDEFTGVKTPGLYDSYSENIEENVVSIADETTAVREDTCIMMVLKALPKFKRTWERYVICEPEHTLCEDFNLLSSYIQRSIRDIDDKSFKNLFIIIERLVSEGNSNIKEAATKCFLRNLQNIYEENTDILRFVNYLGRKSKEYCIGWDKVIGNKTPNLYK